MLRLYDTLSKQKKIFQPLVPNKVSLYVCGITVYDFCHLGHARALVAFDVLVRYLKSLRYEVVYIRNITDVDDKIINRAQSKNESAADLAEYYIQALHEDCDRLCLIPPTEEPRATIYIQKIIQLIEKLYETGYAYVGGNGDVYYSVNRFEPYGKLSRRDVNDLLSGARVEISESKKNPLDFVLWKLAKPLEPSWDSPWGKGRPGWHIECSAMAMETLGNRIDIHGGGSDLIFPHHENEIAQTEAVSGEPFANFWVHVGMLQIHKEKMSKSLGNTFTIREILKQYPAEVVRYFLIANHYRSPLGYDNQSLKVAEQALQRLYIALRGLSLDSSRLATKSDATITRYHQSFISAMEDDLNTPEALAVLFEITKEINRCKAEDFARASALGYLMMKLGHLLGILQEDPRQFLSRADDLMSEEAILALMAQRNEARRNKDWKLADQIRQELKSKHILFEDTANETIWRKESQ